MKEFGENVGMAFQIRDDLLDYTSRTSILGKPIGGDIKEKKITLPLIYSIAHAPAKESRRILKLIKKGARGKDIEEVINFTQHYGGTEYAKKRAQEYSYEALACLAPFPESDAKNALLAFIEYVMIREK